MTNIVDSESPVVLPGWFIKVFTVISALAIPWAAWVTMTLSTMSVKIDFANRAEIKVDQLAAEVRTAESNYAKFSAKQEAMIQRLDRLEQVITESRNNRGQLNGS
ncbi:hypothetical protein [Rosistilla oblonga]|uniref:hypothetical protein n=1 Tax=Rosistilla oblonga TaxID=2527990 RepID=UPI003A97E760